MKKDLLVKCVSDEEGNLILIYGNPAGLVFLADKLRALALLSQDEVEGLPVGIGEHDHLYKGRRGRELLPASDDVVIGRLDGKGNGDYSWLILPRGDGTWTNVFDE